MDLQEVSELQCIVLPVLEFNRWKYVLNLIKSVSLPIKLNEKGIDPLFFKKK